MIKNAVKHNSDAVIVKGFANFFERFVVTEPTVDFFIINSIIAVF